MKDSLNLERAFEPTCSIAYFSAFVMGYCCWPWVYRGGYDCYCEELDHDEAAAAAL